MSDDARVRDDAGVSGYARATTIMLAALDVPAADRDAFVHASCRGDAALHADVQSLLSAHDRADTFLETSPAEPVAVRRSHGDMIGRYRIERTLGEGGMGIVYLATDSELGRSVALKTIAPFFSGDTRWQMRLRQEARAAAALNHSSIATIYAVENIDNELMIVSEFVPGDTLRVAIDLGRVSGDQVTDIGRQLTSAVAAAHDAGVLHRDLKPENVMLTPAGEIKILDFGLASVAASSRDHSGDASAHSGMMMGTPNYMAPEPLRGEAATHASDIFSLGLILAELSTGRHPFQGSSRAATTARILSVDADLTGIPPALQSVIASALEKLPADRFASARDMHAALDAVARGARPRQTGRRTAFWWWQFHQVGVSIFSVIVAAGIWAMRDDLPAPYSSIAAMLAIVAAIAGATLHLNRWFTARLMPTGTTVARVPIIARIADLALGLAALAVGGFELASASPHVVAGPALIASAAIIILLSLVIESGTEDAVGK